MSWKNKQDIIYGITFIDHKTKCVFNGSDLGKIYSAKAIIERCHQEINPQQKVIIKPEQKVIQSKQKDVLVFPSLKNEVAKAIDNLSEPITTANYIPYQLKKSRKKKKRKRLSI